MTKRMPIALLAILLFALSAPVLCYAAQTQDSADYTASLGSEPGDEILSVGDMIEVSVQFSSNTAGINTFHTYDVMLSYDAEHLTLASSEEDSNMDILTEGNWIRVKGYGTEKNCSDPAVTLKFKPRKPGTTGIRLVEARADYSDRAGKNNMQRVLLAEDASAVTVQIEGISVEAEGDGILMDNTSVAIQGKDYSFTLDQYTLYDYELIVKVDGVDITSKLKIDETKGIHTIPGDLIDGAVEITVVKREPKAFTVKLTGSDVSGEKTAIFSEDYVFRLGREEEYKYSIEVSIDGIEYTNYTMENDVYTIPGADITGDIQIKVIRKVDNSNKARVTFIGAGSKDGSGEKLTEKGVEYPFKIKRKKGYTYSVTVYVNGKKTPYEYDYELDTYYIMPENVYDEINIAIGKVPTVEICEYVTLDKESLFLVVYNGIVNEGQVPRYDGRSMYWSDRYKAYAWLVASTDSEKKVKKAAEEKIAVTEGTASGTIDYTGNVNMTFRADAADLQLVREIYEGKHSLDFMAMQKLLNADICSDRKVNIRDVVAIIKCIS